MLVLAQLPVGIAEDALVRITGEKGEDAFLASTALGDVVLLHQDIVTMERDGMEVEVKRLASLETQGTDSIEPEVHELGIAGGMDPTAVFSQKGSFRNDVEPRKQGQPWVEDRAHDVAVASVAKELEAVQRAHGRPRWDHDRARKASLLQHLVQGNGGEVGSEEEESSELGTERAWAEIEGADISDGGSIRACGVWAFVISSSREPSEALLFEDHGDGRRAERVPRTLECIVDVIDGQVLFAHGDDLIAKAILLRSGLRALLGREEKLAVGVLAELMTKNAKAALRVAKALGHLLGGEVVDEVGSQGLVLTVGGVRGFEEEGSVVRYPFSWTVRHVSTVSSYLVRSQALAEISR